MTLPASSHYRPQAHDVVLSRPHVQGRAVHCSCGEVFVHENGTEALLAQMDHRDAKEADRG